MDKLIVRIMILIISLCSALPSSVQAQYYPDTSKIKAQEGPDIWSDMRRNFQISFDPNRDDIATQIEWYQNNPNYLYRALKNAAPYLAYVYSITRYRELPAELALIPFIESEFNPFAYSHTGAAGIWQFMPGTATGMGVPIDWWYDGRRDVVLSTRYALDYLCYLHDYFNESWLHAIAAYDSGEGTVSSAVKQNGRYCRQGNYWQLCLPNETAKYVPKLLALVAIIKQPEAYGLELPDISLSPYFDVVDVKQSLPLSTIAKLANVDRETLRVLNAGFRRPTTGPKKSYSILLPIQKIKTFQANFAKLNTTELLRHHVVKAGENLKTIALKYHTSVALIKKTNGLNQASVKPKQDILIPNAKQFAVTEFQDLDPHHESFAADNLPGPKLYEYTVKKTDNFESIAKKYAVHELNIRFWNNQTLSYHLKPGDRLVIWTSHKPPEPHVAWVNYKVHSGDNLAKIAHQYHTSIKQLQEQNKNLAKNMHVGKQIKVPVTEYS
jgi:membrane-bound lytic murein transglycosylase D